MKQMDSNSSGLSAHFHACTKFSFTEWITSNLGEVQATKQEHLSTKWIFFMYRTRMFHFNLHFMLNVMK